MTVQLELNGELEEFAQRLAERDGVSVEALLSKAAQEFLSDERREEVLLEERTAEAERGEFLTEAEMAGRFQKMLRPR
jgi:predicted transcriptional regulator